MRFWVDWAMWEKLCFVLAGVLLAVLGYSFGVLIHKRRMLKKHTIAEENEKGAQDAERHPMLNCSSDVPFGARALERGVQVEGIWVSSSETLNQIPREFGGPTAASRPATPMTGSPLKKASLIDSSDIPHPFPRYPSASHGTSPSKPVDDNATSNDEATGDSSDAPRASQQSYHSVATYIEPRNSQDPGPRHSRQWFGPRSSWITKPISYKRGSGISQETHRQSSEDFRRRFSRLFDEQLKVRPAEAFQLDSVPPTQENDKKRPPRPQPL